MGHLTTEQLAARWHMHPKSLANWRTKGLGPKFIKPAKVVLYPLGEVEEYERQHTQKSTVDNSGQSHSQKSSYPYAT